MSGGHKYASRYAKYRAGDVSDSDFTSYVDSRGDLAGAWNMINAHQTGGDMSGFKFAHGLTPAEQAEYWIKRGATSKASFGRAHAAEDADLFEGTYRGATKYAVGSKEWLDYFKGKDGTYFDKWKDDGGGDNDDDTTGTGPTEGSGTDWSPLMDFEYTPPNVTNPRNYMPSKNTGIWGDNNLRGLLYNPGTKGYDKTFKTSQYMDWDPVEVESGVPGFGSRFKTFDLPDDDYWNSLLEKESDEEDDEDQRGGRSQSEIDEQERNGYFVDKYGNKVKRGYASWADFLAGRTLADRAKAAGAKSGAAGSGNVGATTSGGGTTPADSGQGVSHGSANPNIL